MHVVFKKDANGQKVARASQNKWFYARTLHILSLYLILTLFSSVFNPIKTKLSEKQVRTIAFIQNQSFICDK